MACVTENVERAYLKAYLLLPEIIVHLVDSRNIGNNKGENGSYNEHISSRSMTLYRTFGRVIDPVGEGVVLFNMCRIHNKKCKLKKI